MICDHYVYAARVGILDRLVGSNACITGDNQFRAVIDDWLKTLDMNAMTLLATDGNVIDNICAQRLERLHQDRRGRLTVHVKVAPDADHFILRSEEHTSE